MKTYYALKWVDSKGRGTGGSRPYQYDLPKRGKPGRWHRKHKEAIRLCANGFHCTSLESYRDYSEYGPRLFIVEIAGKFSSERGKVAVEAMRLIVEVYLQFFAGWLLDLVGSAPTKPPSGSSPQSYACGDERLQFLIEQCSSMKQEFKLQNCAMHSFA